MRFSANLGFLWTDRPLIDRVHAAAEAGFDAVECHFPYDVETKDLKVALIETGLQMLGLNTVPGNVEAGEFGLAALPGEETRARNAIDQAIEYADAINTPNIHVMAGKPDDVAAARSTFIENLNYASQRAAHTEKTILIEPINTIDAPGYYLHDLTTARSIIDEAGQPNIAIMFDCYHLAKMGADVDGIVQQFNTHSDKIGHIQFASVPDRAEPNTGSIDYAKLLPALQRAGYNGTFGAEYKPTDSTESGLSWLQRYQTLNTVNAAK